MKKTLLQIFMIALAIECIGQNPDKLILKDKSAIEGKIIQVTATEVEIKPTVGNPFLKYKRSEVSAIVYGDNTVVTFDGDEDKPNNSLPQKEIHLKDFRVIPIGYGNPDNIYYPKWLGNNPKEKFTFKDDNITAIITLNFSSEKYFDYIIAHSLTLSIREMKISGEFIVDGKTYFLPIYEVEKKDKDYRHTLSGGGGEYFLIGDKNLHVCENLYFDFSLFSVQGFDLRLDIYLNTQ